MLSYTFKEIDKIVALITDETNLETRNYSNGFFTGIVKLTGLVAQFLKSRLDVVESE